MKHLRTLFFLFTANTISGFAQGITMLAIPWYIIQTEDGKFLNASMVAVVTLLSLFWGLYAGTLVDRYNRKHIFLSLTAIDFCILLSIAAIGFVLGTVPFFLIATVYLATIFTYNVHYPNLYAFVQELFEPEMYGKVNSAIEIQGQTTNFLGMMIGALLLDGSPDWALWPQWLQFDAWQLHEIFLLDGSTYILGCVLISQIPYRPSKDKRIDKGAILLRLRQGFGYLQENRALFIFGLASYVLFFSLLVVVQAVAPIYVNDYLKEPASVLALFKGSYAIGAITAGIIGLSAFVRRTNLISQIIFLLGAAGILYLTLAATHSVPLTIGAAIFLGICNAGTRILRITYLVRIVPNHVIGRVNSLFAVLNVLMRVSFLTLLTIPFFSAEANGPNIRYAIVLLAGIMFLAAGTLLITFRRFSQKEAFG
ncbi:MAG: MFS transporter [Bacteroidota bacterium]